MSTQALSTVGDRGLQLNTLDDVLRFAKMVLAARLAPKSFKDESQIVVALQMGMEVGLPPMQSLQSIAVINGNPAIYGDGGTALVRSSGLLEDMVEEYVGEGDQLTAACKLKRKGQAGWIVGTFSVADAKKARLWGKQGPWTDYPRRMLMWRARSWAYRDGFADVLRGMRFVEEERDIPVEPREVAYTEAGGNDIESLLPPMEEPQEPQEVEIEQSEPDDAPKDETPDERAERQLDEDFDWLGGE